MAPHHVAAAQPESIQPTWACNCCCGGAQAERHRATQLKEAALDLIAAKPAEAMAAESWQRLGTEPDLLQVRAHTLSILTSVSAECPPPQELFAHKSGVRKRPRESGGAEGTRGGDDGAKRTC